MKNKILSELKAAEGYISGERISKDLGVSRTAVWKNINLLKDEGYIIDSVRNRGYMLKECPDIIDTDIIKSKISVDTVGTEIIVMKSVDSTNNEIKRRASNGAPSGLIIAAETQTAGKGRFGRSWESSKDGLYFTALIRPELPPVEIPSVTLASGYAVCLAIRKYTGCDAKIKWPNDIIIGRKKICGILTEMAAQSDRLDYVAIGIGINVNNTVFADEIKHKATSLFLETGKKIDRTDFFAEVINSLDKIIKSFLVSVSAEYINEFKKLCATLGQSVSVERNGNLIKGVARDITPNGELIIDCGNETITVNSGEISVQGIY